VDTGNVAFLQQAHRNNWQQYLASLKPGSRVGFDVCVLTASDERQAIIYCRQLAWRREAGLLPARTHFLVIPDPAGRRIGSGGATLYALEQVAEWDAEATDPKVFPKPFGSVLMIHSGGDSKRLPHCSAIGKLFARVPRTLPDGRASTIFDEFLISLSALSAGLPPGVLISSGDVLLIFDHLQLSFRRPGAIGVATAYMSAATAATGCAPTCTSLRPRSWLVGRPSVPMALCKLTPAWSGLTRRPLPDGWHWPTKRPLLRCVDRNQQSA
jgi:hypothetical protein